MSKPSTAVVSASQAKLPKGTVVHGRIIRAAFGKAVLFVAETVPAAGTVVRTRAYTPGGKKALGSYSRDQRGAFALAILALDAESGPEPTPEPKRTTRKARKARKGRKGPARKAQPSQGRGEAAAEASLEAAMATQSSGVPTLWLHEKNFAFYARCVAAGMTRKQAAAEYRKQAKARAERAQARK